MFGVKLERESLVSALSKKVMKKDRFIRTGKNTFALKGEQTAIVLLDAADKLFSRLP